MKNRKAVLILLFLFSLLLSFTACGGSQSAEPEEPAEPASTQEAASAKGAAPTAEDVSEAGAEPASLDSDPVRVMTLNGTTGFGMAALISAAAKESTSQPYVFSVETDASNVTAALVSGDTDIAALPTNAAAALYNKTGGKVQVLALNTRGVLYVVSDGTEEIASFEELDGRTVYVPAQNPSFIFRALCEANGINVTIDNSYAQPADLNSAVAAGQVALAVLPEPMVTISRSQNEALRVLFDLTEIWDTVFTPGSLVQGCVAVRTDFAASHPEAVALFLQEYENSVAMLEADPDTVAQMIEETGIFAKAAVAEKALPRCNICFVTGEEMQAQLSVFLETMASIAPDSIGGSIPGDDFYCIPG